MMRDENQHQQVKTEPIERAKQGETKTWTTTNNNDFVVETVTLRIDWIVKFCCDSELFQARLELVVALETQCDFCGDYLQFVAWI